ncbi:MAG: hypothetical protein Q4D87_08920 [Actinomycetaceae bacterium]|nr:hypothetical protein [Actinomycetaceae bacterium]
MQAQIVRTPGQAFRIDEILFNRKQVANLAASARRRGFQINSIPAGDLGESWPMFEEALGEEYRDRRVIFIMFNPKLQQAGASK